MKDWENMLIYSGGNFSGNIKNSVGKNVDSVMKPRSAEVDGLMVCLYYAYTNRAIKNTRQTSTDQKL